MRFAMRHDEIKAFLSLKSKFSNNYFEIVKKKLNYFTFNLVVYIADVRSSTSTADSEWQRRLMVDIGTTVQY